MKFDQSWGTTHIILEKGDRIVVTTEKENTLGRLLIEENNNKLDISGKYTIVNSISGERMLEKVHIPPVISKEDIVKKCDEWINLFKEVHDEFKTLVLSNEFIEQGVRMQLAYRAYNIGGSRDGGTIELDLIQPETASYLKRGVTISVDEDNRDVYAYLVASVLDYYLSKNCDGQNIDLIEKNYFITSNAKNEMCRTEPIATAVYNLVNNLELSGVVFGIVANHNLGQSSEQIIEHCRNEISSQKLCDGIDEGINESKANSRYILKKVLEPQKGGSDN